MKTKYTLALIRLAALLLLLSAINYQLSTCAQGTAFTYQGVLTDQGGPVTGTNDLTFTLFTTPGGALTVGTSNVINDLVTTNGVFTVTLDYGAGIFDGNSRWLQIAVRPGISTGPYTNVNPRQRITPAPYAIFAGNSSNLSGTLPSGALSGVYTNAITLTNAANNFRGKFTGNGSGLTNVDAATLAGLPAAAFWQVGGNTLSPGDALGSANNQAMLFVVNGFPALQLLPNTNFLPSLIGGGNSSIAAEVFGAVISGGFANAIASGANESVIAGGSFNNIGTNSDSAAISGGDNNKIQANARASTIAGGESNIIETNSSYTFIGGGLQNSLLGNNTYSAIVCGNGNTLRTGALYSSIGGGRNNTNSGSAATIAGGEANNIQAGGDNALIAGGLQNTVTGAAGIVLGGIASTAGANALAAGRRAKATHLGSFVLADNNNADVTSGANNQVTMRFSGGYRLFSDTAASVGVALATGGNSWSPTSDRSVKENFQPVDCRALLEKVLALPVTTWNLKTQPPEIRHIGAMAQDFKATFAVGEDDRHISTSDADGVTLAAIQGLNQKLEDGSQRSEVRIQKLEVENAELKRELSEIKRLVLKLSEKKD